jgi:hypothetical protein
MSIEVIADLVVSLLVVGLVILFGLRLRRRRPGIGSAAVGSVYDLLSEDKRNAVEMIVEGTAAKRRPEHPDDTVPPDGPSGSGGADRRGPDREKTD